MGSCCDWSERTATSALFWALYDPPGTQSPSLATEPLPPIVDITNERWPEIRVLQSQSFTLCPMGVLSDSMYYTGPISQSFSDQSYNHNSDVTTGREFS